MSLRKSVLAVGLSLLAINAHAATTQQQLDSIQAQIAKLNAKLKLKQAAHANPLVALDTKLPMAGLTKVHFPLAILQNKNLYQAPLTLGGHIEMDAQTWNGSYTYSSGNFNQSGQAIALTKLYLFSMANLNDWTTAVVAMKNTLPANSVAFDRAFLVFGNLTQSPWYVTTGNAFLPFGNFSGNGPLDNSLTTSAFRVNPTTQATMGYDAHGFDVNAGVYNSSFSHTITSNYLANISWTGAISSQVKINLGGGYLADIRGTGSGLGESYTTATPSNASPFTAGKTGAYDLNATYSYANWSLLGEYNTISTSPTYNNQLISKPSVWMLGTVYKQTVWNRPTQFQLSYSETKNMQNVELPASANFAQNLKITGIKSEWLASVTSEVWNNIYVGPEFAYNHLYVNSNTWTATLDATAYF